MKLPINWLKDYVTIPQDVTELMQKLTSIGHMQDGPPKNVGGDIVYELEIRQNRSDCLSILGLAREAAAVLDEKLTNPVLESPELPSTTGKTHIQIEDKSLCYRFNSITIDNIKIESSPEWLVKKLESYGMKSINNLVDITNFVMIELGQPLHAFDISEVNNQTLVIRKAIKGEKITVIGGKIVELTENDLVIADSEKTLAMAGVIGGENSGVKETTSSIILEAATYNQASIRRSSIQHSIRTEASTRLEKFLHPQLTELALQRAAQLIHEICGGNVIDHTDSYPTIFEQKKVTLKLQNITRIGGINITIDEAKDILEKLEIESRLTNNDELEVDIPYFRTDLEQEADLIEEVLRIYGYDNIVGKLPFAPPPQNIESKYVQIEETIRDIMIGIGFDEEITDPLTKEENPELTPIVLQNSLSSDKTMMRTTLEHKLLNAVENQKKHRKNNILLFEVGKIYFKESEEYKEKRMLGLISQSKNFDYTNLKGSIELLYERLGLEVPSEIHIKNISNETFFYELDIEELVSDTKDGSQVLTNPLQIILQDLSLSVPSETRVGELIKEVKKISSLIYKISLGEKPQQIDDQHKSVFLHVSFHSPINVITNEDVEIERKKISKLITETYKGVIR